MRIKRAMVIQLLVLALLGSACSSRIPAKDTVENKAAGATRDAPRVERANDGGQTIVGEAIGSGAGRSTSRSAPEPRSSSKDTLSRESLQESTNSQDREIAGSPVSYTDQANDAHAETGVQNAALSQKAFDILQVEWAPATDGYSTSISVAGAVRDDG
jgi:hypothetical protein